MKLRLTAILACCVPSGFGCTSDLPAPSNYAPTAGGGALGLRCEEMGLGAVGASFSFSPIITGEGMSFMADDLPAGLAMDSVTGEIRGVPTEVTSDPAAVTITAVGSGGIVETTCEIQIRPQLEVDLQLVVGAAPSCLRMGDRTLLDLVVDGTGDGSAITCRHPDSTSGDGRRPAGISVNEENCQIEGTVDEDRYGTWVFIVRGEQSGAEVFMPYCVTNAVNDGYEMVIDHSGNGEMGTLLPIVRRFNPNATVSVSQEGDPLFRITDPDACSGGTCNFRFQYRINASPFDPDETLLNDAGLFTDPDLGRVTGFEHQLTLATNGEVSDAFKTRPWVVNLDVDYCLSTSACPENLTAADTGGLLTFSVLMLPGT